MGEIYFVQPNARGNLPAASDGVCVDYLTDPIGKSQLNLRLTYAYR